MSFRLSYYRQYRFLSFLAFSFGDSERKYWMFLCLIVIYDLKSDSLSYQNLIFVNLLLYTSDDILIQSSFTNLYKLFYSECLSFNFLQYYQHLNETSFILKLKILILFIFISIIQIQQKQFLKMKLSNFRIKDRIQVKNQRTQNPSSEQDLKQLDQHNFKSEETKFSLFLQSFEKLISSFTNSNQNEPNRLSEHHNKNSRLDQVDFRDRFVVHDLPDFKDRNVNYEKLENWLGEVSSQILSVAFHYLTQKKMDYNQMKAFASQSFLRNFVLLAGNCDLTAKEMEFIDQKLKQKIFPYLKSKYPLTSHNQVNKALSAEVMQINHSEVLQNDYLFSSGVTFEYREEGRYDDLIMRLLNQIMTRCDGKEKEIQSSNFKQFQLLMTDIFEKSYEPDEMNSDQNKLNFQTKEVQTFLKQEPQKRNQAEKDSQQTMNQAQKYKEKVKQYTSFLIGRKISQNVPQFTKEEIQSKSMNIKSPAILRILTKWCEELWAKFENENYFWERKDGLSLNGIQQKCSIDEQVKKKLTDQVKTEKVKLQQLTQKIRAINYAQQVKLLQNELTRNDSLYIEKQERVSGLVACKIVNNLESFIIDYLNSLIHGLLKVSKNSHFNLDYYQKLTIPTPLNLLSFKVSDILRCKYASKEKEVLKIFKIIKTLSKQNPQKFKIVRIKNRLKLSTNDILINAKLNNTINCEIQIAVNIVQSNFIECSNKINHYIYELERAQFGPVLQVCSIWKTYEKRSETFVKMIEKQKPKPQKQVIAKHKQKENRMMIPCTDPFVCSQCSLHYYQNNFIVSHESDEESTYWKCARCLIKENIAAENVNYLLEKDQNKKYEKDSFKFCKENFIPKNGACIFINKPVVQIFLFKKILHKQIDHIVILKNDRLSIMKSLNPNKAKEKDQFFKDYVVFNLPQDIIDAHFGRNVSKIEEEVASKIILPNQFMNFFKESRQSITILSEEHLSKLDIQKSITENAQTLSKLQNIKSIEFSGSKLSNFHLILPNFTQLRRLILNKNEIQNISRLCEFKNLQKVDLSQNQIKQIPQQISNLVKIKELRMRKNLVQTLPEGFFELKSLDILDMSNNKLVSIPQSFAKLQNLTTFWFEDNKLKEFPKVIFKIKDLKSINFWSCEVKSVPEQIGELTKLQTLNLNENELTSLPQKIGQLKCLTQLYLYENQLTALPDKFYGLHNLATLNLNNNQFTTLSDKLCDLNKLTSLNLLNNLLTIIPDKIGNLKNLVQLRLSGNKLTILPESVGDLKNLVKLYLDSNQLKIFPDKMSNLISLNLLDLRYNRLKIFPEGFCDLKNLTLLNLGSNHLTILPQRLSDLKNLILLDLNDNKFAIFPEKLVELKKLTKLYLQNNQLIIIPEKLGDLKNLTILNLKNNRLTTIPEKLSNLIKLTELNLSCNQIKSLPENLGNLKNLTWLSLADNQLTNLPENMRNAKNLTKLILSNNKFTKIPLCICSHLSIQCLYLENNLIDTIPIEINQLKSLDDERLYLSGNPIKQVGDVEFLLKKFPGWKYIQDQLKQEQKGKYQKLQPQNLKD